MDIERFGPDDAEQVTAYAGMESAVRAADSPWQRLLTARSAEGDLRYGWDGEVDVPFLGRVDGVPVAYGTLGASEYDNRHYAWFGLAVLPDQRRRGHGSAMLAHLIAEATRMGRGTVGFAGWDNDATRGFGARHGFEVKSVANQRHQTLADVDWPLVERLHAEAEAAASAYELVRRLGRTPDDELGALADLTAAINDAPTDDLDLEDEVFPPERIRGYEDAQLAQGYRFYRVLARHRATGELAGHSVVTVEDEDPTRGDQHDTAVVGGHRGHRLGLLLKTEMNLWLREAEPQLTVVSTWNAESNGHMIGVNEQIGYRLVGRELELERKL